MSSDWVPLKTAILDQNGNTTREQLLGWVSATGCPSINYCIGDWLTNVQNCASDTSCTITWACENDGGTVADIHNIAGTCLTDNTGEYCPGSSTHVCGCAASIEGNPCPQLIPPAEPDDPWGPDPFTPYVIEEDEYGGWIYLAPCGADTPIGQDGQCDGTSTPCTNCDPMPYNNGNPINPE